MGLGKTAQTLSLLLAERADPSRPVRADPARLPDVAGQQLAEGGGPVRARACGSTSTTAAPASATTSSCAAVADGRPGHHHLRHGAARPRRAARRSRWGRVVCDEAQAIKNSGTRQAQAVRAIPARHPARADRHAGGEPPGRALVDHGVLQPGPARPGEAVPAAVPGADRGAPGRGRHRGAQAGHRAVRAAPPQDRQVDHLGPAGEERDEGLVHAHRRAGDALPGRGRGHDGRRSRAARASSGGAT